jgi:hypothetical protein
MMLVSSVLNVSNAAARLSLVFYGKRGADRSGAFRRNVRSAVVEQIEER